MLPTRGYGVGGCVVTWGYGCPPGAAVVPEPVVCNFFSPITTHLSLIAPTDTTCINLSLIDLIMEFVSMVLTCNEDLIDSIISIDKEIESQVITEITLESHITTEVTFSSNPCDC